MTDQQLEKTADEDWAIWRRAFTEMGVDVLKLGEVETWHHAYRFGYELGCEAERDEILYLLERMGASEDDKFAEFLEQCSQKIAMRNPDL